MKGALPQGWVKITLADHIYIAGRIGWRGLKADEYTDSGPILLSVPNLNHGDEVDFGRVNHITEARFNESPEIHVKIGDTLLVKDGAGIGKLGYIASLPSDSTVNSSLLVVRPQNRLLVHKYLYYYLKGPDLQAIALQRITGSATPHLFQKDIKTFNVVVPPLAEQRRIVAKLEALLVCVRTSEQRLERVSQILKRFRQAVLAAGCSGRLTIDWRSKPPTNDGDDLPAGWRAVLVGDVIGDLKYGTAQKCSHEKRGTPVLRIPNVANGVIDLADLKYATLPPKERDTLRLVPGDILIIRSNGSVSLVGRSALVRKGEAGFAYAGYLIRIRPNQAAITPRFLNLVLGSYNVRLQIELEARSTSGVNNINSEEVRQLHFHLPPLEEQKLIIRRVEAMFSLADRLEARLRKATDQAKRLTQSILARAFRGELVATEAELAKAEGRAFESADQLLQRIQMQNDAATCVVKAKSRKRTFIGKDSAD